MRRSVKQDEPVRVASGGFTAMLLAASLLVVLGQTTLATAATIRTVGWPGHRA